MIGKRSTRAIRAAAAALLPLLAACGNEYPQTTFQPVTEFGEIINSLFYSTTAWTIGILVVVEAVLLFILFRFRERPDSPEPEQVHGNTAIEIVWTIIPAIIVAIIAIPAVQAIFELQRPADEGAFEVEVIGHQWWWEFRYPELEGVVTANEMHVPVGRPIYLTMRSNDVIHSFWVPRLGGKRDVNPVARVREGEEEHRTHLQFTIDEPGEYLGQCAEYCGLAHAVMKMRVVAHQPDAFDAWVQAYRTPPPDPLDPLALQGRELFMRSPCIACHSISGTRAIGRIGPDLTFMGDRWTVGAGTIENSAESIAEWIRDPHGIKAGARMPGTTAGAAGMPPTGLSDEQVDAIAAYLFSLTVESVRGAAPADTTSVDTTTVDTTAAPAPTQANTSGGDAAG